MIAILKCLGSKYFTLVQFTLFDLVELGESCKMTDKNLSKNFMVVYQREGLPPENEYLKHWSRAETHTCHSATKEIPG